MKPRRLPMKRTELRRATPLQRSTPLPSSGPVKPRKSRQHPEKAARNALPERSEGICETQVPGVCQGWATVCSHRKRRSQSSLAEKWSLANLLHSCLPCELHLTRFDSTAGVRSRGWTVSARLNPADIPVFRRGEYVWLREGGAVIPLDLMEIAMWIEAA